MASCSLLHLGAFMRPASIHTGAWRYPGAWADMNFNYAHLKQCIQLLERAKFDAFFMADHMAVLNMPIDALKRSHTATSFEPFTLLSALSQATERIGLVATGSTTFDAPYHIARRFASLDHISGGRAGWNIVTTSNPDAAHNFGLDEHMEHGERYRRAREFYDVVTGMCSITRASVCRCAARSISPARSRAGRSSCRRAPRNRAASLPRKRRRRCLLRKATSPPGESSMPTSKGAWRGSGARAII